VAIPFKGYDLFIYILKYLQDFIVFNYFGYLHDILGVKAFIFINAQTEYNWIVRIS